MRIGDGATGDNQVKRLEHGGKIPERGEGRPQGPPRTLRLDQPSAEGVAEQAGRVVEVQLVSRVVETNGGIGVLKLYVYVPTDASCPHTARLGFLGHRSAVGGCLLRSRGRVVALARQPTFPG